MFLHERIQLKLNEKHLRQADIARATGKSTAAVAKWLKGDNVPKTESLKQIAQLLGTTDEWLLTGKESAREIPHKIQSILDNTARHVLSTDIDPTTKIWLPLMDISFSCGNGEDLTCHFEETKKKLAFEPDFLESRGIKEQNVRLLYATGDSMEEFIYDGDIFAIDISDTDVKDGLIYAVYFEGEALLKQIFKEAGGTLILHSKNPKYPDKVVSENNGANFKVLGRQFWRAG